MHNKYTFKYDTWTSQYYLDVCIFKNQIAKKYKEEYIYYLFVTSQCTVLLTI